MIPKKGEGNNNIMTLRRRPQATERPKRNSNAVSVKMREKVEFYE